MPGSPDASIIAVVVIDIVIYDGEGESPMFGTDSDRGAEQLTGQCGQYGVLFHRFRHIQKTVYGVDNPRIFAD